MPTRSPESHRELAQGGFMTRLYLIRHGRSTANAQGLLSGRLPGIDLDEHGIAQAKALAKQFGATDLKAIVSSPVSRCQQTANFLSEEKSMGIVSDERFTEMDFGLWQGRFLADLAKEQMWTAVQREPSSVRFPEGETFQEVANRSTEGIRHWNDLLGVGSYAVFTHADVIKVAVAQVLGLPLDNFQRISVDPCSITIVDYADDKATLRALNVRVEFSDSMVVA